MRLSRSLLVSLLLLSSCGYRFVNYDSPYAETTLSIPYVQGDLEGKLTSALIRQIALNTPYRYRTCEGRLRLEVTIISDVHDYIGFQYDRDETTGEIVNRLQADEERHTLTAEVLLIDTYEDRIIMGPITIKSYADYDYVDSDSIQDLSFFSPTGQRRSVLQFSLGQLDAFEDARRSSQKPLYESLAKKIALGLLNL